MSPPAASMVDIRGRSRRMGPVSWESAEGEAEALCGGEAVLEERGGGDVSECDRSEVSALVKLEPAWPERGPQRRTWRLRLDATPKRLPQ